VEEIVAHFTVVGGGGFIGSEICAQLKSSGHSVFIPLKRDTALVERELGIVIYCAGHGDCVGSPFKVLESNVFSLANIVEHGNFERLVYLSSTRLYMGQQESIENCNLVISATDKRRLFNLTKLVSEELCFLSQRDIIIARPSNVYGMALKSPLYLPSITRNAIIDSRIDMYVSKQYTKDYVSVEDVAGAICRLALTRDLKHKVYNIASGNNTSSSDIADLIQEHTGCNVIWHSVDADSEEQFPVTSIQQLTQEIDYEPSFVLDDLPLMIFKFKKVLKPLSGLTNYE
jgi:nucleoside-diphosphate-sugar epimerase